MIGDATRAYNLLLKSQADDLPPSRIHGGDSACLAADAAIDSTNE